MSGDPDDDLGADAEFEGWDDCQGDHNGFCHLAGTESCDWDCPMRQGDENDNARALRAARADPNQLDLGL